jgi:hypothetical protein
MKRLKRALFSRDADATVEEGAWIKAAWRAAKQLRDTRSDPCPQIVRLYAKASEPRMERVTESAGITTVFREHYKQLGSPLVCAEFDADNFDRVTAKVQGRVTEYQAECKYDEPFTKKEMERAVADLPTYKAGDAADLKVSSSKLAGRR